jgi:alpha-acetolactate decarboxylase
LETIEDEVTEGEENVDFEEVFEVVVGYFVVGEVEGLALAGHHGEIEGSADAVAGEVERSQGRTYPSDVGVIAEI